MQRLPSLIPTTPRGTVAGGVCVWAAVFSACTGNVSSPADSDCGFSTGLEGPTPVIVGAMVQLHASWASAQPDPEVNTGWNLTAPHGSMAMLDLSSFLDPTFVPDIAGPYSVTFGLTEIGENQCGDLGQVETSDTTLAIQAVDLLANAGPTQNVDVGSVVILDGSNSVGSSLSYTWLRLHRFGLNHVPATGLDSTLTFTMNEPDSLVYRLTVADVNGLRDSTEVTVRSNVPAISALTPNTGPGGTVVWFTGRNFNPDRGQNNVTFNGVWAGGTSISNTTLVARVPINARTGPVGLIVEPTHDAVVGPTFTVTPPPVGLWVLRQSMVEPDGALFGISMPTAMVGYAVGSGGTRPDPMITKTLDGGATWAASVIPGGLTGSRLEGVSFNHPDTGTAVGQFAQIYRTEDGGLSWLPQTAPPTSVHYQDVSFADGSNGVAVGASITGTGGVIVRTTDGGATPWSALAGTSQGLFGVHMLTATEGWAVGSQGTILHSTDGTNWIPQPAPIGAGDLNDVFFLDATNGWAAGKIAGFGPAVIVTTDGGATWNFTTTQPPGTQTLLGVSFSDTMTGVVVGWGGNIFRTTDGGASWFDEAGQFTSSLNAVTMTGATTGLVVGYTQVAWLGAASIYQRQ
jgi:photosystem II stability/assembly factor-like uncharacterized protein